MKLYLVRQTQPESNYFNETIAIFDNLKTAQKLACELNKKYGCGCVFNDKLEFVEFNYDCEPHYYDVETQELNPDIKKYL